MKKRIIFLASLLISASAVLSSSTEVLAATANATGGFTINIPAAVSLVTDAGNANDTFPAMTITINSAGTATGSTSLTWNLISNTAGGAIVTAYIPNLVIPTSAGPNLKNDLKVVVTDASGPQTITPSSAYIAGRAFGSMPTNAGSAETMFSTAAAGQGRVMLTLTLNAPAGDGSGNITGTITMIATTQ